MFNEKASHDFGSETCDICGEALSIINNEDFFVEDEEGSHVYCEKHWIEYEAKNGEIKNVK